MKSPRHLLSRVQDKKSLRLGFKLGALLTLASASAAQAVTYDYVGTGTTTTPTTGNFSGTGFTPGLGTSGGTPVSTTADTLVFAGGTAYTATDDFGATILANALTFSNQVAITLARGTSTAAGANSFTLGGTTPAINLNNTAGTIVTDNLDLVLGATTTVAGVGSMTMTGTIGDGGNGDGLTMNGTGNLTLSGATSYTGATTLNNGTVTVAASGVLSSGSALVFGATNKALLEVGITTQTVTSISAPTFVTGSGIFGTKYSTDQLTIGGDNSSTTYNDVINQVTLVKNGTGTVTLGGTADNGAAAVVVNAGTLILAKSGSSGAHGEGSGATINGGTLQLGQTGGDQIYDSSPVTMTGGTFDLNGTTETIGGLISTGGGNVTNTAAGTAAVLTVGATTTTVTFAGTITDGAGTMALAKIGTGIQVLSGTNTYSGGTTVSAGTLELTNFASLPNAGVGTTVAAGTANVYAGSPTLTVAVGGTSTITSAQVAALAANATFGAGTLNSTTYTLAGALGFDTTGGAFTESGNLGGTLSVTKMGAGTLTLSGTNTYSGVTTIPSTVASGVVGGTIAFSGANAVSPNTVLNPGVGDTISIQNDAAGTINLGNEVFLDKGNASFIDVRNNGGTTTGSTVAFGPLVAGLVANRPGETIYLTGANGYNESFTSLTLPGASGSTTILSAISTSVTIGNVTNQMTTVGSGNFDPLDLNGNGTNNFITGVIADSPGHTGTTGNTNGATALNINDPTLTVDGILSGINSTWTLSGANTYTGNTTIFNGTLDLTGSIASGSALVMPGGTLNFSNPAGNVTQTFYSTAISLGDGSVSINDTVAGNTLALSAITRATGSALNFTNTTGAITTTTANTNGILGPWATIGTGASTEYAVSGASATTAITGLTGTAAATAANLGNSSTANYELASATGTTPATVSANTIRYSGGTGTLTPGATSFTLNGLLNVGGGTLTVGTGTVTIGTNKELVLNAANGNINITGPIVNNGTSASAVTISGPGVVTFSGANTYTAATFVDAGSLVFNGTTNSSTNNVGVYTGATVLGNGKAPTGSMLVYQGANLAPGATVAAGGTTAATPGMLSVGALTMNNGSNFNVLLNENASTTGAGAGTLYSQLTTTGVTTLASTLNVTVGNSLTTGDKFFILLNSGSTALTAAQVFSNAPAGSLYSAAGDTFMINYADNGDGGSIGNDISLTVESIGMVPEPSTVVGGLMTLGLTAWNLRRRFVRGAA